jgi:hypothetical protein
VGVLPVYSSVRTRPGGGTLVRFTLADDENSRGDDAFPTTFVRISPRTLMSHWLWTAMPRPCPGPVQGDVL